jgi:hypothetical protein
MDRKLPSSQNQYLNQKYAKSTTRATSLPTEIRLTEPNDEYSRMDEQLNLPVQVDTVTEILQERLQEMTNNIDRREQQLLAKLQTTEDRMHRMDRKTTTERQNHRQYIEKTLKRLEEWEENLLQREQTMDRNKSNLQAQYDRYTRKYDELQQQTERAITAWQEIAQTTLKEKIDNQIREQTTKIEEFATDQEQKLISLLDGYEEHARGIQAKLLTRLHTDIKQTYTETRDECRQNDAIPVDEEDIPLTLPDQPITQPSVPAHPASVPPPSADGVMLTTMIS